MSKGVIQSIKFNCENMYVFSGFCFGHNAYNILSLNFILVHFVLYGPDGISSHDKKKYSVQQFVIKYVKIIKIIKIININKIIL